MENAIYWNNVQVGVEVAGRIQWFTGAPPAAISFYSKPGQVDE